MKISETLSGVFYISSCNIIGRPKLLSLGILSIQIVLVGSVFWAGLGMGYEVRAEDKSLSLHVPIGRSCVPDKIPKKGELFCDGKYEEANDGKGVCTGSFIECTDDSCSSACVPAISYTSNPNSLFSSYISLVYSYLQGIVATLAAVMIVWGGIEWVVSAGNSEAINSGKEKIFGALLGLGLFILAGIILQTINPCIFGGDGC